MTESRVRVVGNVEQPAGGNGEIGIGRLRVFRQVGLAELVRAGEVKPVELVDAALPHRTAQSH
jgi:hypothetical protein